MRVEENEIVPTEDAKRTKATETEQTRVKYSEMKLNASSQSNKAAP